MNSLYNSFVSICERSGDSIALIFQNRMIDYNTLYNNVQRIHKELVAQGIKSGDIVGLSVRRSPNVFAYMLALLKIGAAYMPFNPLQTESEWLRMIEESHCKAVINDRLEIKQFFKGLWIEFEEFEYEVHNIRSYDKEVDDHTKNLVYVIYTSGSTGKAKGVGIRQESLKNLIEFGTKEIGLTKGQRIIAFSDLAFDMSVPETIIPILIGMSVVLLDDEEVGNPRLVRRLIQNNEVTTLLITPTRMRILLGCKKGTEFLSSLRFILLGAEMISNTLKDKLKNACDARIFNLYGPTETTVYLTYSDITDKEEIDIGRPIENTQIHLLDDDGELVEGVGEGEIVISGIGVADGYIATDVKKAFRKEAKFSNSYVYYTGDMAKRLENGDFVYTGRKDNQIKYRGYRLGLEAIEDIVKNQVKEIQDCVISVYKNGESEYLTMLYVSETELEITQFKHMVCNHLASYATPLCIFRVKALPLNKNSKIDRASVVEIVKFFFTNSSKGGNVSGRENSGIY